MIIEIALGVVLGGILLYLLPFFWIVFLFFIPVLIGGGVGFWIGNGVGAVIGGIIGFFISASIASD